jgi:lysophospholipase L1-like esterase
MRLARALFLAVSLCIHVLAAEPPIRPNDRIALCGDPVTAGSRYAMLMESYLLMSVRTPGIDVSQLGWGGQTAEAFLARLEKDLLPYKPTVVTTCFGMDVGDPGRKDLDAAALEKYRTSHEDLVKALKKSGVRLVVIGSPKCVDSFHFRRNPEQAKVHNDKLAVLAETIRKTAEQEKVGYADVFGASLKAMDRAKAKFGREYALTDANGNPGDAQCVCIAYAMLRGLGCDGLLGTITIDYAAGTVSCDASQKASVEPASPLHTGPGSYYTDLRVNLEATRFALGYPGYPSGRPCPDPIFACLSFYEDLCQYRLIARNIPTTSKRLKVYCNDPYLSKNYTCEELAKGVNIMPAFIANNPLCAYPASENVGAAIWNQRNHETAMGQELLKTGAVAEEARAKREKLYQEVVSRVPRSVKCFLTLQPLADPDFGPAVRPVPVIFDTDMNGDVDDVGALALLNSFMCQGECELIACVANTRDQDLSSGAVIQAVNAYYGHPAVPVGAYQGEPGPGTRMTSVLEPAPPGAYHGASVVNKSAYTLAVRKRFAPDFPKDDQLPAGVDVYRKALAKARDRSVVIVSVGWAQNLQDLVQSKGDTVSDLGGIDLLKKKARLTVIMANTQKQDAYLLDKWPTPIVWTTHVGHVVYTGNALTSTPKDNPVRVAYSHFFHGKDVDDAPYNPWSGGRQSWDLTASWLGVRGTGELWDLSPGVWEPDPNPKGWAIWFPGAGTNQYMAQPRMDLREVTRLISDELCRPPSGRNAK